jgi:hypothetical protein
MNAVTFHKGGSVSFTGDAVQLYRAMALVSALKLAERGLQVHRTMTRARTLRLASDLTGKRYKRGAYLAAAADVQAWVEACKASMPVIVEGGE